MRTCREEYSFLETLPDDASLEESGCRTTHFILVEHKLGILEEAIMKLSTELRELRRRRQLSQTDFDFSNTINKAILFISKGSSSQLGQRLEWVTNRKVLLSEELLFSQALLSFYPKSPNLWNYRFLLPFSS